MAYLKSFSAEEPIRRTMKSSGVFNINLVPVGTLGLGFLSCLGFHVRYDGLNGNILSVPIFVMASN